MPGASSSDTLYYVGNKMSEELNLTASGEKKSSSAAADAMADSMAAAADDKAHQHKKKKVALKSLHQVPVHLRFNRFVLGHYRPKTDWKGCLGSLFYLHNETVNIFTHAIPIVIIALSVNNMLRWSEITIPVLPWIHVFACLSPWTGSTLYHLFMSHELGYPVYKFLLGLDMFGIWIAQTLGSLVPICATIYCMDQWHQILVIGGYVVACVFSCYKAITARDPWERRYSFIAPFLTRMAMVMLRIFGPGGGQVGSVKFLLIQDALAISGAYIGATNIPERWFPGSLDLFLNSHHFMHVMVVLAAYYMHLSVDGDLIWMSRVSAGIDSCPSL